MKTFSFLRIPMIVIIFAGFVLVETFKLESSPHFEFDEGWTALVARHWVEKGHYGLWLNGKPAPPTLNASFPTTGLVSLSFKGLGVGIWQGRLVGVLFMIGSFFLLFFLARRLFNSKVALLTMAVLCLSPLPYKFHPLGIGRQILAEPQMLFFLLAGYLCFLSSLTKPNLYMPLTVLLWGIALITKAQVLPFFILALIAPLGMTFYQGKRKTASLLAIALFGSLLMSFWVSWVIEFLLQDQTLPRIPVKDLHWIIALVFKRHIRVESLVEGLKYGWPIILGLGYGFWKWRKGLSQGRAPSEIFLVRLSLLLFAGGWLSWFLFLAIGYRRYLLPPVFIGSLFVADLINDLLEYGRFSFWRNRIGAYLHTIPMKIKTLIILVFLVGIGLGLSYMTFSERIKDFFFGSSDIPLFQAAQFLNNHIPPGGLVESYDSQLLFLLDRPYHCPPPQVNGELTKRVFLRIPLTVDYDPLLADPDYLVIGPFGHLWGLYDPVLGQNQFRLLRTFGLYDIYARWR